MSEHDDLLNMNKGLIESEKKLLNMNKELLEDEKARHAHNARLHREIRKWKEFCFLLVCGYILTLIAVFLVLTGKV